MQLDRVLFVGAHADDIELFSGGLLARTVRESRNVHILVFSSHRGVTDHEQARQEFVNNMRRLDIPAGRWTIHDYEACTGEFLRSRSRIYDVILATASEFSPTLVVTHARHDTNQDHEQVRKEVVRSLKSRCSIISGEYPFNQVTGRVPDLFIALHDSDIQMKVDLITAYESQKTRHRSYFDPSAWKGLARMRGAQIQASYAEGYFIERVIIPDET
jgi:LmbE family N-acetylglucosaminyl deacetylase